MLVVIERVTCADNEGVKQLIVVGAPPIALKLVLFPNAMSRITAEKPFPQQQHLAKIAVGESINARKEPVAGKSKDSSDEINRRFGHSRPGNELQQKLRSIGAIGKNVFSANRSDGEFIRA